MIGQTLSHFKITAKLGEGGMGEVYRAEDTKLGREVAIKVLPESLTADQESLARFGREAKVLASLNHQNIAGIHQVEEVDGTHFLVMELVDGETLQERLVQGPVPAEEVLPLALQIAEALEAAHEHAIVHRDLKPANIKITPDDQVKVLDFGLAKPLAASRPGSDSSEGSTLAIEMTQAGVILGTAAYMSPEQARGRNVDKRTDNWAFGCVLYEMITGYPAFGGKDAMEILAAVVTQEPDWMKLPDHLDPGIQRLLHRCLRKDPRQRLHDIADARIELLEAPTNIVASSGAVEGASRNGFLVRGLAVVGTAAALTLGIYLKTSSTPRTPREPMQVPLAVESDLALTADPLLTIALSPDARSVIYRAKAENVVSLYLLDLSPLGTTRRLPGTDGAEHPIFSPSGQWIAFFAGGTLKRMRLDGGGPIDILKMSDIWGASWISEEEILVTDTPNVLRVNVSTGRSEIVASPDPARGEFAFTHPQMLPGGKAILYTLTYQNGASAVALTDLASERQTLLVEHAGYGRYVPSGHILFVAVDDPVAGRPSHDKSLMAVSFDADRVEIGAPVRVREGILADHWEAAQYDFADETLLYMTGPGRTSRPLVRIDPEGTRQPLDFQQQRVDDDFRISPDGRQVALSMMDSDGGRDLWIYDVLRDDLSRLTSASGWEFSPIWSLDGDKVAFTSSFTEGGHSWKRTDGTGPPEELAGVTIEHWGWLKSWSRSGIAYVQYYPDTGRDIWVKPSSASASAQPFVATRFDEDEPAFSPDGHWIAYHSNETGQPEIYIRRYPDPDRTWKLTTEGGSEPRWSTDGRRIYYRHGDLGMAVGVRFDPEPSSSAPEILVEGLTRHWDVAPDGSYFLGLESESREPEGLYIVLDWLDELRQLAPTD